MKPLNIPPDGNLLHHDTRENTVDTWNLENGEILSTCPGSLIGVSHNGSHLLTSTPAGVEAWNAQNGSKCDLFSMNPADFELCQRFSPSANRFKLTIELRDVFDLEPSRLIHVDHDPRYYPSLDTWSLAPDNQSVAVALSGEVAGQDWAVGYCMDLNSGQRRFKFKVNRFQSIPSINFSREHNYLLVSSDIYHLGIFDLATGHPIHEVWVGGFANVASASTLNPSLVVVNVWEPTSALGSSPFSIQVLNLSRLSGSHMQRARIEAIFAEPEAIVDLLWSPDGYHVASLLASGVIHWWNLSTGVLEKVLAA
jgi:WD40 repeat protein